MLLSAGADTTNPGFLPGLSTDGSLSEILSSRAAGSTSSPSSSFPMIGSRSWKSTLASLEDYDDEEDNYDVDIDNDNRARGHAEAAMARAAHTLSHDEPWMINLGRDGDNEWLLGPRNPDDWFTGLKPSLCPGKLREMAVLGMGSFTAASCRLLVGILVADVISTFFDTRTSFVQQNRCGRSRGNSFASIA